MASRSPSLPSRPGSTKRSHRAGGLNPRRAKRKSLRPTEPISANSHSCGRVARRIGETYPQISLTGADIDGEAIEFLSKEYASFGRFVVLPHLPPSDLPAEAFDLIYGISVFTHLAEDMQFLWLQELFRVAKPGAYLLLTTRGRAELAAGGFEFVDDADPTQGLPGFYRTTYYSRDYIERAFRDRLVRTVRQRRAPGHRALP